MVARNSGRARPLIVGYHTAVVVPFLPDAEKLTAIREAIPALAAGIYLNTGSVGPLPAETAAAMAEMANRERDVGRAHPDDVPEMYARMAEARAGVAAVLGTDVERGRPDPLDDRRHERRHAAPRLAPRRPCRDRPGSSTRAASGRCTPCATGPGVELVLVDAGDDGDDAQTIAAFDAAITPGHAARLAVARRVDHGRRSCPSRRSPRSPTPAARSSSSTAPRPPARSRSASMSSAPTCTRCPAQKWLLGPEGMGALVVAPSVAERYVPALAGWFSFERVDGAGLGRLVARRAALRDRRASIARRSSGWPARSAGCRCTSGSTSSIGAGSATAAAAADRLAAIPGVTVLTPRRPDGRRSSRSGSPAGRRQAALEELGARVVRDRPDDREPRCAPDQRRLLHLDEELERFAGAVELLAAHTPETIPPRRTLTILGGDDIERRRRDRRRAVRGRSPALLGRGPLAPVPQRAAPGRPGGRREPVRRGRPGDRLPRLRRRAEPRRARCPGGDLRAPRRRALRRVVLLGIGSAVTYLVVPQPTGAGTVRRRERRGAPRSDSSRPCRSPIS